MPGDMVDGGTGGADHSHNDHSSMMGMDMPGMSMTFHGGYENYLLFDSWKTNTSGKYAGASIFVLLLAFATPMLYFYISDVEYRVGSHNSAKGDATTMDGQDGKPACGHVVPARSISRYLRGPSWRLVLFSSIFRMIHAVLSYALMLVVMTYNSGFFVLVILGLGMGFAACRYMDNGVAKCPCCRSAGVKSRTGDASLCC